MIRVCFLVMGLVLSLTGGLANATPVVSVGNVIAPLNGTVSFQLMVSDSGNAAAQDIEGMLLTLQIGDGSGATPKIQSIDMLTGTIWSGHASSITIPDGGSDPQFAARSILTDTAGDFVVANGVLATVVIDTTGAAPGNYSLKLTGVNGPGSNTDFQNGLGSSVSSVLTNGVLTVPEPASASGVCAMILCLLKRRTPHHRSAAC